MSEPTLPRKMLYKQAPEKTPMPKVTRPLPETLSTLHKYATLTAGAIREQRLTDNGNVLFPGGRAPVFIVKVAKESLERVVTFLSRLA